MIMDEQEQSKENLSDPFDALVDQGELLQLKIKAKNLIFKLLARREYSQYELTLKLQQRGIPADLITEILVEFSCSSNQSDYRCAQMLLSHGFKSGWGPNKIKQQMLQKGLSSEIISQCFAEVNQASFERSSQASVLYAEPRSCLEEVGSAAGMKDLTIKKLQAMINSKESSQPVGNTATAHFDLNIDWYDLAKQLAIKKFGPDYHNFLEKDLKAKAKLQRLLYNRGFEAEHINFVIKNSE